MQRDNDDDDDDNDDDDDDSSDNDVMIVVMMTMIPFLSLLYFSKIAWISLSWISRPVDQPISLDYICRSGNIVRL